MMVLRSANCLQICVVQEGECGQDRVGGHTAGGQSGGAMLATSKDTCSSALQLSFPPQELLQAKQDLQDLLIAKEEQEDLLRKRERELTALKGALKEEVSSHDQEMDKLKEQYDAELQALRESVEEATKVSLLPTEGAKIQPDEG